VKIQLRNQSRLRMPTPLGVRKAASGYDRNCEGRPGIAGVPSSGHVSKDFPRTQESSPSPLDKRGKTVVKGNRRRLMDGRAVLRPYSTSEGGEPQGFRIGAATGSTGGKGETR
jgi:hypothetical protein